MNEPNFQPPEFIRELDKRIRNGRVGLYKCGRCDREFEMLMYRFNSKDNPVKSCGCYKKFILQTNSITHGMTKTKEYQAWCDLRKRCQKDVDYAGRGIKVCDRWLESFENFYKDMGNAPEGRYSIHRINNDGNYELENCKWATDKEQARVRRNNKLITYKGYAKTIAEWSDITGLTQNRIFQRIFVEKWSIEDALITTIIPRNKRNNRTKITINLPEII